MSKVKAIIAAAVVVIIGLTCLGIGIAVNQPAEEAKVPTSHMLEYHGFEKPHKHSIGVGTVPPQVENAPEIEAPVLIPSEEALTSVPQSFAPTNTFVEEGEVMYYGWKVDRDEPIVEEPEVPETPVEPETPEQPEEPEEKPNKPNKPGFKFCKHGFINPIFCWICGGY